MANPPCVQRALEWGMARLAADQRTVAERKWHDSHKRPKVAQKPMDIGLFDDSHQLEMCEMFHDPTNGD